MYVIIIFFHFHVQRKCIIELILEITYRGLNFKVYLFYNDKETSHSIYINTLVDSDGGARASFVWEETEVLREITFVVMQVTCTAGIEPGSHRLEAECAAIVLPDYPTYTGILIRADYLY